MNAMAYCKACLAPASEAPGGSDTNRNQSPQLLRQPGYEPNSRYERRDV